MAPIGALGWRAYWFEVDAGVVLVVFRLVLLDTCTMHDLQQVLMKNGCEWTATIRTYGQHTIMNSRE